MTRPNGNDPFGIRASADHLDRIDLAGPEAIRERGTARLRNKRIGVTIGAAAVALIATVGAINLAGQHSADHPEIAKPPTTTAPTSPVTSSASPTRAPSQTSPTSAAPSSSPDEASPSGDASTAVPAPQSSAPRFSPAPSPSTSPSSAPSVQETPTGAGSTLPPPCATHNLTIALGTTDQGAGQLYYQITFTNAASVTCTLLGRPGVAIVGGADGHQIGAAAVPNEGPAAATATLAPGQSASSIVHVVSADIYEPDCKAELGSGLRVYSPGDPLAAYVEINGIKGCQNSSIQLVDVGVITKP